MAAPPYEIIHGKDHHGAFPEPPANLIKGMAIDSSVNYLLNLGHLESFGKTFGGNFKSTDEDQQYAVETSWSSFIAWLYFPRQTINEFFVATTMNNFNLFYDKFDIVYICIYALPWHVS